MLPETVSLLPLTIRNNYCYVKCIELSMVVFGEVIATSSHSDPTLARCSSKEENGPSFRTTTGVAQG